MDVALFEEIPGRVIVFATHELSNRARDAPPVARQHDVANRPERVHDAGHVGGLKLVFNELREHLARSHTVLEPDVVIVEKDREQPHVVARGLGLLFDGVANFPRRIASHAGILGHVDQLERLDCLRFAVFGDLEVLLPEIVDRVALLVGDDHVHANEIDVGTERRSLRQPVLAAEAAVFVREAHSEPSRPAPEARRERPP